MARDKLKQIRVSGIACCVPENSIDINEFGDALEEKGLEKFKKTTGIYKKHCCKTSHIITAGDLCYTAAERLLKELDVEKSTIDAVIFVSQSADYLMPATACVLQYRLGLSQECLAYDINLGCSGYIYGLHTAGALLQSGNLKKVLFLAGEAAAHTDPVVNMLFGEAGSATLLEYDETGQDMNFLLRTQGKGFRYILAPYGSATRHDMDLYAQAVCQGERPDKSIMDGAEVFNFSIREVPTLIRDYMDCFDAKPESFDVFALHQANQMILQQIVKRLKLPKEKCPISLDIYGNTSSASVPLTICDYFNRKKPEEKDSRARTILTCGYGVGLSLGVTAFSIPGERCFPVLTTNEAFEDGIL